MESHNFRAGLHLCQLTLTTQPTSGSKSALEPWAPINPLIIGRLPCAAVTTSDSRGYTCGKTVCLLCACFGPQSSLCDLTTRPELGAMFDGWWTC